MPRRQGQRQHNQHSTKYKRGGGGAAQQKAPRYGGRCVSAELVEPDGDVGLLILDDGGDAGDVREDLRVDRHVDWAVEQLGEEPDGARDGAVEGEGVVARLRGGRRRDDDGVEPFLLEGAQADRRHVHAVQCRDVRHDANHGDRDVERVVQVEPDVILHHVVAEGLGEGEDRLRDVEVDVRSLHERVGHRAPVGWLLQLQRRQGGADGEPAHGGVVEAARIAPHLDREAEPAVAGVVLEEAREEARDRVHVQLARRHL
mmetsp:Transcript_48973/g.153838  ORF Transcript_48973/g.153838 Transcript_48973/m.153838 type:complete len:258 (+) Transcript_48973:141-914(+)